MHIYAYFDETKCMYFFREDETFFDKYNEIWEKVSNIIKKLVYNKKYLKATKKINTKEKFHCACA